MSASVTPLQRGKAQLIVPFHLRRPLTDGEAEAVLAALADRDALKAALEELLAWAERYRGGDKSLSSEEWYIVRDHARVLLADTEEKPLAVVFGKYDAAKRAVKGSRADRLAGEQQQP